MVNGVAEAIIREAKGVAWVAKMTGKGALRVVWRAKCVGNKTRYVSNEDKLCGEMEWWRDGVVQKMRRQH